jgi:CheY-like chemotaxis protein
MITIPLRILLVEDNETDALLIQRQLRKLVHDPQIAVVDGLDACRQHLVNFIPDLVISDYNLPACTGMDVLRLSQEIDPNLPFIFVTGTIDDEELAANTILAGASGYILKKNMKELDQRLKPLLKMVVLQMSSREEVRERIRQNKISVNQIRQYLDSLNSPEMKERQENIAKIRKGLEQLKFDEEE